MPSQTITTNGDLDDIFSELQPVLIRAATRWAPVESIDDVVQETWIGVLNGIDRFEGRSQLSTWVLGILWRQCCRQWRQVGAKRTVSVHEGGPDLVDCSPDPSREIEMRDDVERTLVALEELPERYRTVILLNDVMDRPSEEIRDVMNLTEVNHRVLLHRARRRVRSLVPDLSPSSYWPSRTG